jgi:hypothetical protein
MTQGLIRDRLLTGEVAAIRENGAASGIGLLATFGYDGLGRRTSLARGNGTSTGYAWDAVSRLSQLVHDLAGTANDLNLGYSCNPASQIVANTRSNDPHGDAHDRGRSRARRRQSMCLRPTLR